MSVLLLVVAFLGVGYASLSDGFTVTATIGANWVEPNILYTSAASVTSGTATVNYHLGSKDISNPAAHLSAKLDFSSSETVQITLAIKNNFSVGQLTADFVFKGLYVEIDSGGELVSYDKCSELTISLEGITAEIKESGNNVDGTPAASGETVDDIKLTLTRKSGTPDNIHVMFSFKFGYESPDVVDEITAGAALNKFKESINLTEEITINGKTDTAFNHIISEMSGNGSGSWGGSYVGNVTGDNSSDSKLIEALFGETLNSIQLDGETPTKCTVMIKRKNVDSDNYTGESGDELVVMLTPDDIANDYVSDNGWQKITVYVSVFSKVGTGEWVRIGDVYKGIADANNYDDGSNSPLNSFDTESWLATKAYYGLTGELTAEKIFGFIANGYSGDTIEEVIAAYKSEHYDKYAADLAKSTATNTEQ